jgi:hypothetical protein
MNEFSRWFESIEHITPNGISGAFERLQIWEFDSHDGEVFAIDVEWGVHGGLFEECKFRK